MEENTIHPEETGLADELNSFIQYEPATQGQRFLNWLIDNILLRIIIQFITGEIFIRMLLNIAPEYTIRVFTEKSFETYFISYLIAICHYIFYYTICEKAFKGYTLGKLITGTRAIRMDGQELTLKDALLRSLSRMVPFEAFSGFGDRPWHDNWTKTVVVKAR
jgi:uncharacterized RDD family membrane protein YckC